MRHRRHGRVLGRAPSHRKALLRNLASALFLTERLDNDLVANKPKVKGRIITTLAKAKEIRPMVEKCVTIAKRTRVAEQASMEFGTQAVRHSAEWKQWREGPQYAKWVAARAPVVTARRKLFAMLRHKEAVEVLIEQIADRFADRPGGYTRILKLATPRLGDAGPRAILEFTGKNDRVHKRSEKPDFGGESASEEAVAGQNAQ
jgi:large subunit ribosomal protein L17